MMKKNAKKYTISVYSENIAGLLGRIAQIFTRRKINIDSLTTSDSEIKGIHRFTIVIHESPETVRKLVQQIEKIIDVFVAFYYEEDEIIAQEIALYKLESKALLGSDLEDIVRKNAARILYVDYDFCVIEKTGLNSETQELFDKLSPYGILEFVRSGRVAISKPMPSLHNYLESVGLSKEFQ